MEFLLILKKRCSLILSHVGTLQNEVKSCNLGAEDNLFKPKPVLVLFEHVTGSMEARLKKLNRVFKKMYPISKLNFYQPITSMSTFIISYDLFDTVFH